MVMDFREIKKWYMVYILQERYMIWANIFHMFAKNTRKEKRAIIKSHFIPTLFSRVLF